MVPLKQNKGRKSILGGKKMKRIMVFLLFLFVSMGVAYSGEVTLGLGWRISNSGIVLGEFSLPITTQMIDYYDEWEGESMRTINIRDYTLSREVSSFLRQAYFIFGMDFFLYKKQVSLGFELSAGFLQREMNMRYEYVTEVNDIIVDEFVFNDEHTTTIIPANLFVLMKYKFSGAKIRPYLGLGGGLNAAIFLDGIEEFDENNIEIGEKTFIYSGALLAIVGVDLFFSKKVGIFIEFRYIKPLSQGENFRNQTTVGVGFRFI